MQARGAAEQSLGRNSNAGANDASLILAFCSHTIEGGCRTEIYDNAGTSVFLKGRNRIHNPVGAHLGWILIQHRHTSLDPGLNEQRLLIEISFTYSPQRGIQRRYNRRNHDAADVSGIQLLHGKQVAKEHPVFVYGLRRTRSHTPVGKELFVFWWSVRVRRRSREYAEDRIAIANIEDEKHWSD